MLKFKSLRTRLVFWFLLVTLLSLATAVTVIYFHRSYALRHQGFDNLQMVRDLNLVKLSHWFDERNGDLKVVAWNSDIRALEDVFAETDAKLDPATVSKARNLLQRYLDNYNAYTEVFIINAFSGKVVISTDSTREGVCKKTDLYLTEPIRTRETYIRDVYFSETLQAPSMTFSTPIFCLKHEGEHIVGVLVARIDLEEDLYPLIEERTGMGDTGETLIVNKDCFALNALRWKEDAVLKFKISAEPAVRGAAGETGVVEGLDYRGEKVLAAYTHIPETGWGFVAKRDLVDVYSPIRAIFRSMFLTTIAIAFVVVLISIVLGRSISRPIVDIQDAVRRFTDGDLTARTDIQTDDEVGALALAFNDMADHLQEADRTSEQNWLKTGLAGLADAMRGRKDLSTLCGDVIAYIARYLDVQVGTLSLVNSERSCLTLSGSYAYKARPGAATEFGFGEGLIGQAAQGKKRILLKNVPKNSMTITSAVGEILPDSILCVPVLYEGEVNGVIELGSLRPFTDLQLEFLDQAVNGIAIAINSTNSRERMQTMLEESQVQAEELQAQQEELRVANEELQQKGQEMEVQHEELEGKKREMEVRQEEQYNESRGR